MSPAPPGSQLHLQPDVRRGANGWLLGGSPARLLRLASDALPHDGDRRIVNATGRGSARLIDLGFAWFNQQTLPDVDPGDVSVVVPARCEPEVVSGLLAGLSGLDVVLVDDCSATPLDRVAARYGARYVRLDRNLGPAAARNTGFAMTSTPVVIFADADTRVTREDLLALARNLTYDRVAAAAPRVVPAQVERPTWISRYEASVSSLDMGPTSSVVRPGSQVGWVPSAVLALRRAAVGDAPFDASMRTGEDVDLVWRLEAQEWLVYYDATVVAQHQPRRHVAAWARRKFAYGRSAAPLHRRHGAAVAPARLGRVQLAAAGALASGRPALAAALLGAQAVQVRRAMRPPDLDPHLRSEVVRTAMVNTVRQTGQFALGVGLPFFLWSRRSRRFLIAAALVDGAARWASRRPHLDPLSFTLARRLDDGAYSLGVWTGSLLDRNPGPVLPVALPRRTARPAPRPVH